MHKKDIKFIIGILYVMFLLVMMFIYGYNKGILHAIKDMQITQDGDIIRFTIDNRESIYILDTLERR